mgnify:CR=1 FL=1
MTSDIEPDGLVSADEALARLMAGNARFVRGEPMISHPPRDCLLYTSDAADDLLCVDLGGRRIIKKKNIKVTRPNNHLTTA